ncbi:hypothetical protein TNCV_4812861 [Trichonephila clavipes]|nr:hypothetical protein TNCV_4812861 [Trichonephila clavipes]
MYRLLPNSTNKFIETIIGSTGTTNHHTTWDLKPSFVGENHDNNSYQQDEDSNKCWDLERRVRVEETCTYMQMFYSSEQNNINEHAVIVGRCMLNCIR